MEANDAALKIQKWWKMHLVKHHVFMQAKKEFESLCTQIGDRMPIWPRQSLCTPLFEPPSEETEKIWLRSAIGQRIYVLKYQEDIEYE